MIQFSSLMNEIRKRPFFWAFWAMIFMGYTVGKDMAQRDNARDRLAASAEHLPR